MLREIQGLATLPNIGDRRNTFDRGTGDSSIGLAPQTDISP
jgi:hypothetical protein